MTIVDGRPEFWAGIWYPPMRIFDPDGSIIWSFEALLRRYHPIHRRLYAPDMQADEVPDFKRHDTDRVEIRTTAYWYR